ncbi:amidase signature enzyme [Lophiostoma macrostomum CBS 122681]|uniref:Amidase signature enzyme n=1 Tax=Lophiostoma macrostomum CBS 122681 TaxID=1314788 RepID=A0A6A6TRQ3_9PLEO|nr:amidase signature enzyme [Lophiostoma macrostomum CBS 122681]
MPGMNPTTAGFIYYPHPKEHDIPYKPAPPPNNPVVKGVLLHYLAYVVTHAPLVPSILWHNAGFGALRKLKELSNLEPRYEPAVIPVTGNDEGGSAGYTRRDLKNIRVPPKDSNGRFHTVLDVHDAYKSGTTTPSEIVERLLPLIRRDIGDRSPHSTAFVDSKVEIVRQAAEESSKRWKAGTELGVLDGVPFAVKDDVDVKGYKRYVGSKMDYTEGREVETSWCAKKLEEEGAICVGKLNMHELGMDTTNLNTYWGTPLNPYNERYYCGGSSGGPAYAVASGLVPFAIGSDGGGSIRVPSSFCGLYGLKPSHGRVSIAPVSQSDSTTVVQGPLAANMGDLLLSYHVLAQPDPFHHISRQFVPPGPLSKARNKILGIYRPWFDLADPSVRETCYSVLHHFTTELGYELIDISIPLLHEGQLAHAMTIMSETVVAEPNISNLTAPTRVLLKVAQQTPASDFLLAQRMRNLLMQHLAYLFQTYPGLIIVTPTTPNAGCPINKGELAYGVSDGNTQIRTMEYVWLANFTGIPCIQVPVGYVSSTQGRGKVPVGLSGHGEWGSEEELIQFGFDAEQWMSEGGSDGNGRKKPENWVDILSESDVA